MKVRRRTGAGAAARGLIIFLSLSLFLSCMRDPYIAPAERLIEDNARELFIINSLAETISIIDADAGDEIASDVLTTGMWPNHCLFHRGRIYIVNSGDNSISVFDETSFEELGEIYLGAGSNPWMIIIKPGTDTAYIPCFASGDVAQVDLLSLTVEKRITVGRGPEGGAFQDGKLYVCNTAWNYQSFGYDDGTVSIIDDATGTVIKTLTVEINPQSILAFPALHEVHVICTGRNGGPDSDDGKIVVIDTLTDTVVKTIFIGGSPLAGENALDNAAGIAYLSGVGGIMSYNFNTGTVINSSADYLLEGDDLSMDFYAGLAVDEVMRRIYVCYFSGDRILSINLDTHSIIKEMPGSDGPQSIFLFTE